MRKHVFMRALASVVISIILNTTAQAESTSSNDYEKALSEYNNGKVNNALIHVKNVLKVEQNNLSARLLFAQILLESGELAAAEEQYDRALALKADPTLLLLPYANVLLLQSKYQLLLDKVAPGPYNDTINSGIYNYRASAYAKLQKSSEAKSNFLKALELNPNNVDVMLSLASIASAEKNDADFEYYLALAKKTSPSHTNVWYFQGENFRSLHDYDNAIIAFNKTIELDNNHLDARRSRAVINIDKANYDAVEQDLNFILTKTPEDPFTLLVKAFYLKKINETNQATDILNSTSNLFSQIDLEKFDQFSPLLFIDGLTHYLLGNNFEAKKSLTKYLKKSPDSIEAKEILAEIAFNNNEPDNTIKLLSSIEAQYISLKSATLLMSAYVAQKDYLASTTLYKSIDKEIQENGRLLSLYVLSLISQGKATEAINLLEEQALLKPNSSDIQLMLGYHYLQYQFFDKALIVAKKLETQPNLSVAELNFIGVVYQSNNQTDIAQKYYLQALTIEPFDTLTTMNLVLVLFSKNDYVEANKITQNFLTQYSENISILKLHAESYIKLGNIKEAINSTKFIDEKTQNDLAIKYQLVDLYLKSNKADLALEKIEEIKKLEPLSSASLIAQAKAYLQKNDNEKAAKSLKIVFGLNLENTNRLIKIAQLQLEASDWEYVDKTITQLEKPKLNANYDDVILLKARLLFGKNQLDSAIKLLEQRKNKTADINQYLALFYSEANNTVKAIKHAQDAYLQIKDQATLQLLARLYWQNNQVSDTLNLLKEWLLVSPYDITTKRLYANLLAKNNNTDAAIEEYQDVLIHSPDDVVSLNNVAMLLLQNDKYNEALPLAEKAVKLAPLNATVNDTLGWLLVKSGKAEQGLTYLRESYARDSNNLSTRYHIAIALADTGKKSASITELNAILNLTSSFPERELAASKLKELANN